MKRKDLKQAEELVLNLYNNTHENKIELEKVKGKRYNYSWKSRKI